MINICSRSRTLSNTPFAYADQVVIFSDYYPQYAYMSAYAYSTGIDGLKAKNNRPYTDDKLDLVFRKGDQYINVNNRYASKDYIVSKITKVPNEDILKIINYINLQRNDLEQAKVGRYNEKQYFFYINLKHIVEELTKSGINKDEIENLLICPSSKVKNILIEDPVIHHEIFKIIKDKTEIPFLESWVGYLLDLDDRALRMYLPRAIYNDIDNDNNVYSISIKIKEHHIMNLVSEGLKSGRININNCHVCSPESSKIENLTQYLDRFSNQLITKAANKFSACFDPARDKYTQKEEDFFDYAKACGRIQLYEAQKNVIAAVSRSLNKNRSAFVIGECGAGK